MRSGSRGANGRSHYGVFPLFDRLYSIEPCRPAARVREKGSIMSNRLLSFVTLLIACFSATLVLGAQSASAQDDASYDLQVMTRQCEESPCNEDDATPIGDVTAIVTSEDGSIEYGTCATSTEGIPDGCSVIVDPGTTVSVTVDETTIPDGYVLLDYPIIYEVPAEKTAEGDVWLYFTPQQDSVPDDQDTDEEVAGEVDPGVEAADDDENVEGTPATQLPSTGSGASIDSANISAIALGAFAAIAMAIVGIALANRRLSRRS